MGFQGIVGELGKRRLIGALNMSLDVMDTNVVWLLGFMLLNDLSQIMPQSLILQLAFYECVTLFTKVIWSVVCIYMHVYLSCLHERRICF